MRLRSVVLAGALFIVACPSRDKQSVGVDRALPAESLADASVGPDAAPRPSPADANAAPAPPPKPTTRAIGPYEVPFERDRVVYYVASRTVPTKAAPARLLANLHGVCNPPGYACGYWVEAGANAGFLVCPQGNARCGGSANGSPTWTESFTRIDADLEKAIATVEARHPGEIGREGSILTGFSMGATAAYQIALAHPGRWPYLVLVEANVALDKAKLEAAGIRAVALLAGEIGSQIAGERKSAARLAKLGYPARLWVMRGAGHHYSADIDALMAEAIAFVLSAGDDRSPDAGAP